MSEKRIVLGTRGSELALRQTGMIRENLAARYPHYDFAVEIIRTQGDRVADVPLYQIGDKGLFIKEIEQALLEKRVDLAVHSLKDLPTELTPGLVLAAVSEREDPRDVLISRLYPSLEGLPPGARIGTSSLRRAAQLKKYRPDLEIVPLRGNLDTRLKKLEAMNLAAIVLAAAGLRRMGWEGWITQALSPEVCLPAVGQGALALESRAEDSLVRGLLEPLNHETTFWATAAERSFLSALGGGCQVPIAALGWPEKGRDGEALLRLEGMVAAVDGSQVLRLAITGPRQEAQRLGRRLAVELLERGARDLLGGL